MALAWLQRAYVLMWGPCRPARLRQHAGLVAQHTPGCQQIRRPTPPLGACLGLHDQLLHAAVHAAAARHRPPQAPAACTCTRGAFLGVRRGEMKQTGAATPGLAQCSMGCARCRTHTRRHSLAARLAPWLVKLPPLGEHAPEPPSPDVMAPTAAAAGDARGRDPRSKLTALRCTRMGCRPDSTVGVGRSCCCCWAPGRGEVGGRWPAVKLCACWI